MLNLLSHHASQHRQDAWQKHFDPDACIVTPWVVPTKKNNLNKETTKFKQPEKLAAPVRVPFIHAYFTKKHSDTPDQAAAIAQWRDYPDPNGLNHPEFMPPLVGSAYADCVGIDVLLANPNIDPNIDYHRVKYAGIVANVFGKTPGLKRTQFADSNSECPSPLALVVRKIVKEGAKCVDRANVARQPVDLDAFANQPDTQRYLHTCEQLLDVGARVDPDEPFPKQLMARGDFGSQTKLSKVKSLFEPLQTKLVGMQARVASIISGEVDAASITTQDLKHCYGLGRMADLIGRAQVSDAVRDRLFDIQPQLPDWMQRELAPICAMLKPDARVTSWEMFSRRVTMVRS